MDKPSESYAKQGKVIASAEAVSATTPPSLTNDESYLMSQISSLVKDFESALIHTPKATPDDYSRTANLNLEEATPGTIFMVKAWGEILLSEIQSGDVLTWVDRALAYQGYKSPRESLELSISSAARLTRELASQSLEGGGERSVALRLLPVLPRCDTNQNSASLLLTAALVNELLEFRHAEGSETQKMTSWARASLGDMPATAIAQLSPLVDPHTETTTAAAAHFELDGIFIPSLIWLMTSVTASQQ